MKESDARKADDFDTETHGGVRAPSQPARLTVVEVSSSLTWSLKCNKPKNAAMEDANSIRGQVGKVRGSTRIRNPNKVKTSNENV